MGVFSAKYFQPGQDALVVKNTHSRLLSARPGLGAGCGGGQSTRSICTAAFFPQEGGKGGEGPLDKPILAQHVGRVGVGKEEEVPFVLVGALMLR